MKDPEDILLEEIEKLGQVTRKQLKRFLRKQRVQKALNRMVDVPGLPESLEGLILSYYLAPLIKKL
ncbi:hypothetical protein CMI47_20885 [Candidatus Pacearchaeota archaeon]|jgi:hypothetical protein|nr:hypothetical protein [Candidatus Pacearchaeota archaeon]|tara:strand:+ start:7580 stop:7777 length:198 start_codon:yes stop_codon:yes gene_type:complete